MKFGAAHSCNPDILQVTSSKQRAPGLYHVQCKYFYLKHMYMQIVMQRPIRGVEYKPNSRAASKERPMVFERKSKEKVSTQRYS
jgi:hypothetical protein